MRYHDVVSKDDAELQAMPIRFPRAVRERLRQVAFDARVSMSAFVVEAVREKLGMTEGGDVEEGDES